MSDSGNPFGFGKLVPGFDFLQNLVNSAAQATGGAKAPGLANWIAPTLNVEDLERRISELKAVNFWLDQNSRALAATVQALEVQKMTLATLKGMNFAMGDVAQAFRVKPAEDKATATPPPAARNAERGSAPAAAAPSSAKEAAKAYAKSFESAPVAQSADKTPDAPAPATAAAETTASAADRDVAQPMAAGGAAPQMVDPMQWWGALTSQFQQIAANAMQGAANNPALDATRNMTTQALKAANEMTASLGAAARKTTAAPAAKKAGGAAKKVGARKSAAKTSSSGGRSSGGS